jgi:nucleotide-binding universal stress UspA family protein
MHDFIQKEGQLYLDEIEHLGNQMGVAVSKKLLEGHPAEEIIKETREGDLIVIGSKGRTGLDRLLMGSVAENVARHATCPVMIVK